jgi:hypothetical protein
MSDKVFALATVCASGVFALLVSLVSHFLTASRESRHLRREARRDEIHSMRELYEETIFILDRGCYTLGLGAVEDLDRNIRFRAKLFLHAPSNVREQYLITADKLDEWAAQARKGEPEQHTGFLTFRPGMDAEKAKAQEMWPEVERELNSLKALMKEHLRDLSSGLSSGRNQRGPKLVASKKG